MDVWQWKASRGVAIWGVSTTIFRHTARDHSGGSLGQGPLPGWLLDDPAAPFTVTTTKASRPVAIRGAPVVQKAGCRKTGKARLRHWEKFDLNPDSSDEERLPLVDDGGHRNRSYRPTSMPKSLSETVMRGFSSRATTEGDRPTCTAPPNGKRALGFGDRARSQDGSKLTDFVPGTDLYMWVTCSTTPKSATRAMRARFASSRRNSQAFS